MPTNNSRVYLAVAILAAVFIIYIVSTLNRQHDGNRGTPLRFFGVNSFGIPFTRFAGAETLRNVSSKELIEELEHVIQQNGLPADVFYGLSSDVPQEERDELQDNNIAVTLHHYFGLYYERCPNDRNRPLKDELELLWEASPVGVWDINQETLAQVHETLGYFEERRQSIRDELKQSAKTRFHYVFNRPESMGSPSLREMIVNAGASKYLADYALLEEYAIAQALLDGDIKEAIDALAYIFRITYLASALQDIGARADVAHVRLRTFDVMQRVVLDPKLERQHLVMLRNMLAEQRQHWHPEHSAWFGDRANGLKYYHYIILNNALEPEDIASLKERGMLEAFTQGFRRYHELDMLFYLQAMQRIIDISRRPYIDRLDVLSQIGSELFAKQYTYDSTGIAMEPFVSGFRLHNVDNFMQLFAQDESALNRALLVMQHSLAQGGVDNFRDPFTDAPYEIRRVEGLLSVSATMLPRPFRVPSKSEP